MKAIRRFVVLLLSTFCGFSIFGAGFSFPFETLLIIVSSSSTLHWAIEMRKKKHLCSGLLIRKPELYGVYVINLKRKKVGGPRIPQGFPKPRLWYLYSMRSKNKEQLSLVLCFCGPLHSIVSGGFPLQPFDTDTPSITWLEICGLLPFHLQEILEPLLTYRFSQAALSDLPKPFKQ